MPSRGPPATLSPDSLLRNRNFILLWCAYAVSAFGDHLSEMAILKTHDALNPDVSITPLSARMTFMFFLSFFLLAPIAGLLADRLPRRALMISADAIRCGIMLGFAGLIAWTGDWGAWGPFLPLLLVGAFAALFSPARSALLPTLIQPGQLVRANGMISGLGIIATMAAAAAGGYLANNYAPSIAFRLDAATFVVSALLLLGLRLPRHHPVRARKGTLRAAMGELRAGFHYTRCHRHVLELLAIGALVWFCGGLVNSVIPAIARDVYHGDYQDMSNYRAFLGLGFILGAVGISVLGSALRSEMAMTWGLMGIALGTAVFAASVFLPFDPATLSGIGVVGIIVTGMFGVTVMASFNSLLQRTVADRFRGRVFGVKDLCTVGALLASTGALGVPQWTRVDRWVGHILVGVALITFVAGVVTLIVRLRRGVHGPAMTFAENLNEFVAKFWWRFRRVGRSTVPRDGPVIIAANHACPADPHLLSAAVTYRPISFMVAAEYTKWPIMRLFMWLLDCIAVTRGGQDTAAFKKALRHLRAGKALGIFLEGGIVAPGETVELRDGVAMLAFKTGAKVVPAHISGTKYRKSILAGILTRHRARVRFGKPIDVSEFLHDRRDREEVRAASQRIYAAIQALAPIEEQNPQQPTPDVAASNEEV